jgi:flagellar M-ring protein FliF
MASIDLSKLKEQGQRFANGFTTGQKAVTIAAVIGVFFAMFMFTKWENKTQYAPLFTNLDSKAAGQVTQALDSKGVKWQLADGGATVLVPKANLYKTRADLSVQGVPDSSTDSWSIMDKGGITQDQFTKNVNYQRALQDELAKTVSAIDGVDSATVNLNIPQQSVFVGDGGQKATAAVLVTPVAGTTLSGEKVQAIVNLVSSSVPSLSPDDVTVADSSGNVLSAPGQSTTAGSSQQIDQTNAYNQELGQSISQLLATSLGSGHAAVSVNAALNFDKQSITSNQYTNGGPKGTAIPQQSTTENEKFTGPQSGSTGILGPSGVPLSTGTSASQNYSDTKNTSTYAVDQVHKEIQSAPGSISRLSLAVLLDSSKVPATDVPKWTQAVSAAAGLSAARGDVVSVNLVPFDTTAQKAAAAQQKNASAAQSQNFLLNLLRYLVTLGIVVAVLFLAWRSVKKAQAVSAPVRVPLDLRELEASDLLKQLEAAPALAQQQTQVVEAPRQRASLERRSPIEDDISELIENQPDEVAMTLRTWLADRRS